MTGELATSEFDFVVIGSGPAGQKAAVQAAKAGKSVALVEKLPAIGGACLHFGTIPSKALQNCATTYLRLQRQARDFHVVVPENLSLQRLLERVGEVVDRHAAFMHEQMTRNGIEVVHGRARLLDAHRVEVQVPGGARRHLRAAFLVLATGSSPRHPDSLPVDHENVLDSDSILSLAFLPPSLTVLGGGVIACEYASIFAALGVEVTLIDRGARPLAFLPADLSQRFVSAFSAYGGRYLPERSVRHVSWDGISEVVTVLEDGESIRSNRLLVALGRVANVRGLGLEDVGCEMTPRGHVVVDDTYRTSVPSIYAVGDLIGPPALASHSMEQGRQAVRHALGLAPGREARITPTGIYTIPEIACVGASAAAVRERAGDCLVGEADFSEVARGVIAGAPEGFLRLLADPETGSLEGVEIVGVDATELIHVGQAALRNRNRVDVFVDGVLNFPTQSEAYRIAALKILNDPRYPQAAEPA